MGKDVIVKVARSDLYENEVRTLSLLGGHDFFRQLVVVIEDQSILVLEYLDANTQHVVGQRSKRRLEDLEVESIARVTLKELDRMHELSMLHTGISRHMCIITRISS